MGRGDLRRSDGNYADINDDVSHGIVFMVVILLILLVTSVIFFSGLIIFPSITIPGLR
jgi:hypothetical protein